MFVEKDEQSLFSGYQYKQMPLKASPLAAIKNSTAPLTCLTATTKMALSRDGLSNGSLYFCQGLLCAFRSHVVSLIWTPHPSESTVSSVIQFAQLCRLP